MAGLLLSFDVETLKYANGSLINLIKHKKSESAFGRYGLFWRLAQVKIAMLVFDYCQQSLRAFFKLRMS